MGREIRTEIVTDVSVDNTYNSMSNSLRPKRLKDYIGQEDLKKKIMVYIEASKNRKEPLDHVLLYGPPGLGKTTLAGIIANELGVNIKITSGPAIEKPGELAAILTGINENDVLFIDEIHRILKPVEEVLYSAMEDYRIDIIIGKGPEAKPFSIDLPKFTLIGATTRAGMLSAPLRDRFGIIHRMEYYNEKELAKLIMVNSKAVGVNIDTTDCANIAVRSRGTPRIANNLLKRVRDYAEVMNNGIATSKIIAEAMDLMQITDNGLNETDRSILEVIHTQFGNGPVGIDTLAATTGEDKSSIEDIYEPFLLKKGFINKTPRGRVLTELGIKEIERTA